MPKTSEPRPSAASEALRSAISPKYTQEQIAAHLEVTQQAVSSWIQGRTKPSADAMAKLEDLLGIPMRAWVQPPAAENAPGEAPADAEPTFQHPDPATGTDGVR